MMKTPMRCVFCGSDVNDLNEHYELHDICRRGQWLSPRDLRRTSENATHQLLAYEQCHGDLFEIEEERYFVVVDKSTGQPVMYFQGWREIGRAHV